MLIFLPLFAQLVSASIETPSHPGAIVIFRKASIIGAASACPVRYRGEEIVELGRGKYAKWEVPSGRYILTNKSSSIEVAVDPGEIRYVRCSMRNGAELQIVDKQAFDEHADEYERKEIARPAAK